MLVLTKAAVVSELDVVVRVFAAHGFYHFFAKLHWGRERFGVFAENKSEINVK